jgi:DNA-binding MarR family transcriptional regulator
VAAHLDDELRIAVGRLGRRIRIERADADATESQMSVVSLLWKNGPQTLRSLAELDRVTPPSMNRTVGALAELGFVTRSSSPDDRRKVVIELTAHGAELASETKRRREAWFSQVIARLNDDERAILDAAAPILMKLAQS